MLQVPTGPAAASQSISSGFKPLHYASVDFILSDSGQLFVLEINDHPSSLWDMDQLCSKNHQTSIIDRLALLLGSISNKVLVILPEYFRVSDSEAITQGHILSDYLTKRQIKTEGVLRDIVALADRVKGRGEEVWICDTRFLEAGLAYHFKPESTVVFRRSYARYKVLDQFTNINDYAYRYLCFDKLRMRQALTEIIERRSLNIALPKLMDVQACACKTDDAWVIKKPRYGFGSRGIERFRVRDPGQLTQSPDNIYEEWIKAHFFLEGTPFQCDIRANVVAGSTVSVVLRRSASSANSSVGLSPLSWLTTTGPMLPVEGAGDISYSLTPDRVSDIAAVAETLVSEFSYSVAKTVKSDINLASVALELAGLAAGQISLLRE